MKQGKGDGAKCLLGMKLPTSHTEDQPGCQDVNQSSSAFNSANIIASRLVVITNTVFILYELAHNANICLSESPLMLSDNGANEHQTQS